MWHSAGWCDMKGNGWEGRWISLYPKKETVTEKIVPLLLWNAGGLACDACTCGSHPGTMKSLVQAALANRVREKMEGPSL